MDTRLLHLMRFQVDSGDEAGTGAGDEAEGREVQCNGRRSGSGKMIIRIFRDGVDKDLWEAYCMGLGLGDPDKLKSFKIYVDSPDNIKKDIYDENDNIVEDVK